MLGRCKEFLVRNRYRIACSVPASSVMLSFTALAAEGDTPVGVTGVLNKVTTLITWALGTFTSFTGWLIGDSLGAIYLGMFIIGFAMAAMFRLLHSA